jgi:hypothetical protein
MATTLLVGDIAIVREHHARWRTAQGKQTW